MNITYEFRNGLYINLTNRCINRCVFCDKNKLQDYVDSDLRLVKEPLGSEIISDLRKKDLQKYDEIVFCGVGEPLLRLDAALEALLSIKGKGIKRMNTSGQASVIWPGRNVAKELRDAGLDIINVSLNATDERSYEHVCRPKNTGAFNSALGFARDCRDAGIRTVLSFVEGYVDREAAATFAISNKMEIKLRERL